MAWKSILDEARQKGETLKDELMHELMKSQVFKEFLKSDFFAKAVASVLKTKDEVYRVVRDNVKTVVQMMNLPKIADIKKLETKLEKMERSVGQVGRRTITINSLKKITRARPARTTLKKAAKKRTKGRRGDQRLAQRKK